MLGYIFFMCLTLHLSAMNSIWYFTAHCVLLVFFISSQTLHMFRFPNNSLWSVNFGTLLLIPFSRLLLSVLNSADPCRIPLVTFLRYKNLHLPLPSVSYFLPSVLHYLLCEKPSVLYSDCLVSSKSFGKRLCQWLFRNLSRICQPDSLYSCVKSHLEL